MSRLFLVTIYLVAAIAVASIWNFAFNNNFHAVVDNEVYRSAQITPADMAFYAGKYHIRSIINLRGDNTGKKWYDDEISSARQLNIKHYDFRMSSRHSLTPTAAFQLIALMRDAPKPLLLHCEAGINRTGLASALYIAGVKKGSEFASEMQLSILYGDMPFHFGHSRYAMSDTFETMEPLFGYDS